ncbi:CRISPR-associated protein Cas4 [Candidatus Micrarchaeota archaeon CG11_big_fil_rev_8_21_14_0_20_47_5]|nr:MAG: CRISPR-associated protein Cas4 [Candidatus Micrarchaeota archaeon CG1_02_47_40]PIN83422.1 MAG: CRISPR-associated protein Cas4 [Candidatus Micrarchaeota archaeon CG11_big_fil_rev_8_21_14_0_20_47_5]QBM01443.1 CRISPR-associated exonuclease Cas4 [uncultured archaeon]
MNRMGILSIRDILNYNYCPRIVYFEYVLRRPQGRTKKEDEGLKQHNEFVPRGKRNKMVKRICYDKKLFNLPLYSPRMNLQTVADCVLIDTKEKLAVPMQFKHGKTPSCLYRTMKYQLVAEALLIEECLGLSCPYGLVKFLPEETTLRTEIDEIQKQKLKEQLESINNVVRFERYPDGPRTRNYCGDCWYHGKVCTGFDGKIVG